MGFRAIPPSQSNFLPALALSCTAPSPVCLLLIDASRGGKEG